MASGSASEAVAAGDSMFVDEEYALALAHYERAVDGGELPAGLALRVHSHRAAAALALNRFDDALEYASQAVRVDPNHHIGHYRKGLAAFYMDEFESAKVSFERAQKAARGKETSLLPVLAQWLRKCDAEIASDSDSDRESEDGAGGGAEATGAGAAAAAEADTGEVAREAATSVDATMGGDEDAGAGVGAPASTSAEAAAAAGPAEDEPVGEGDAAKSSAAAPPAPQPAAPPVLPATPFYQSLTHVTIPVMKKGIDEARSRVEFTETSVSASLMLPNGSEYCIDVDLFAPIKPEASRVFWKPTKVEIKLAKATNAQWPALEAASLPAVVPGPGAAPVPLPKAAAAVSAVPAPSAAAATAAKAGVAPAPPKKWAELEKEIEKEEEADKPEGEDALQKLFQQIYKNASDETRRAMNKSFQTSGGTVLSTNWGEVAEADYEKERKAPDGMEWKKWG